MKRLQTADGFVHVRQTEQSEHDDNESGQRAHERDQPEGSVAGDGKGEPDDVGFARAPVAVKNGGGARRVDVARTLNVSCDQFTYLKRGTSRDEGGHSARADLRFAL